MSIEIIIPASVRPSKGRHASFYSVDIHPDNSCFVTASYRLLSSFLFRFNLLSSLQKLTSGTLIVFSTVKRKQIPLARSSSKLCRNTTGRSTVSASPEMAIFSRLAALLILAFSFGCLQIGFIRVMLVNLNYLQKIMNGLLPSPTRKGLSIRRMS